MKNYDKVIEKMEKNQLTLKELGLTMEDIIYIKNRGKKVKYQYDPRVKDYVYYIVEKDMAYIKISEKPKKGETVELKLLEISDIHAGCRNFDRQGLDKVLKKAEEIGVEYVHISGDLFDGNGVYRGQENNLRYAIADEQVDELLSILEKYNFWYIASLGNHDQSFCMRGGLNPIKNLEMKMAMRGKRFTYLDGYAGDIVHAGIIFRLVHLNGGAAKSDSYKLQNYIDNLMKGNLNDVELGRKKI